MKKEIGGSVLMRFLKDSGFGTDRKLSVNSKSGAAIGGIVEGNSFKFNQSIKISIVSIQIFS